MWAVAYGPLAASHGCWVRERGVERREAAAGPVYATPMMVEDERYRERNTLRRLLDARSCLSASPGGLCPTDGNRGSANADMYGEFEIAAANNLCLLDEGIF